MKGKARQEGELSASRADGYKDIGGEEGIRTLVPGKPDHLISSQRRYDRFGTSPELRILPVPLYFGCINDVDKSRLIGHTGRYATSDFGTDMPRFSSLRGAQKTTSPCPA